MANYLVDLNADLGEGFGAYVVGTDEELMKHVTSVNVACGFHAGDFMVMARTVKLAKKWSVAVGAHPGLPDLQGFGRREMKVTPEEVKSMVMYQVGALQAFLKDAGMHMQHVKPHGALYNMAARDLALAAAVAEAVKSVAPEAVLVGLANSELVNAARSMGLMAANEVFADRAYNPDGSLVPRHIPGAVITDPEQVVERVFRMVYHHEVIAVDGSKVFIDPDTVCLHGDTAEAVALVAALRNGLTREGVTLAPIKTVLASKGL
ncbi:LamB/YcsF family protein [Coprothermobacteraceae bacterium]|nr:LamB/YcsF family protein [Coprothermobacteraceae bacterium]